MWVDVDVVLIKVEEDLKAKVAFEVKVFAALLDARAEKVA